MPFNLPRQITSSVTRPCASQCALAARISPPPAHGHRHRLPPPRAVFLPPSLDVNTLVAVASSQYDLFVASANTQLNDPQLMSKITSQPEIVKLYHLALEQPLVALGVAGAALWAIPRILSTFVKLLLTPVILALAAWAVIQHPGETSSLAVTTFTFFSTYPVPTSVLILVLAVIGLLPSIAMTSLALASALLLLGLDVEQGRVLDPQVLVKSGSSLDSMRVKQIEVTNKGK